MRSIRLLIHMLTTDDIFFISLFSFIRTVGKYPANLAKSGGRKHVLFLLRPLITKQQVQARRFGDVNLYIIRGAGCGNTAGHENLNNQGHQYL
jgi:hypothetical protein